MYNNLVASRINENKKEYVNTRKHTAVFSYYIFLIFHSVFYMYWSLLAEGKVSGMVSYIVSTIGLVFLFCFLAYHLFLTGKPIALQCERLFIIFFVLTVLSYFVAGSGTSSFLRISIILMSIIFFQKEQMNVADRRGIYYLFAISVGIVLINGSTVDTMTESKFNPNTCAFLLTTLFCISVARYGASKSAVSFLIALSSFGLQFVFTSRTAMLGCILFLTFYLFFRARKKTANARRAFWSIFFISVAGLLFAYIYSEVLFPLVGNGKWVIFGKDLFTGRQSIWHYTFESIREHLWFGIGSNLNEDLIESGFNSVYANAHNQPLALLAAFGLFPFIAFYVAFSYVVAYVYKKNKKDYVFDRTPLIFIAAVCIMCYAEMHFFNTSQWWAVIVVYGLLFYNSRHKKVEKKVANGLKDRNA